jgi:DNA modification methylase
MTPERECRTEKAYTVILLFYLRASSSWSPPPSGIRKRKSGCSDSIRPMGLEKDDEFNVSWLCAARRVLKPDVTLWVTGTHHIIFSIGFALQRLGFKIINQIAWSKPDPVPNALHTAFTH